MEELQRDMPCSYDDGRGQQGEDRDLTKGCNLGQDINADNIENTDIDPLDLIDAENCETDLYHSDNSDVWKGSDSEEDAVENKNESKNCDADKVANSMAESADENKPVDEAIDKEVDDKNESEKNGDNVDDEISKEDAENSPKTCNTNEPVKDSDGDNEKGKSNDETEAANKPSEKEGEVTDLTGPNNEDLPGPNNEDLTGPNDEDLTGLNNEDLPGPNNEDLPGPNNEDLTGPSNEDLTGPSNEDLTGPGNEVPVAVLINQSDGEVSEAAKEDKTEMNHEGGANDGDKTIAPEVHVESIVNDSTKEPEVQNKESESDEAIINTNGGDAANMNDEPTNNEDDEDVDYGDDFDTALLCPEVSMAVDEEPVITTAGSVPNDGSSSPVPYEPLSAYVDEVTGAEVAFNLTQEEEEMRRRLYPPGTTNVRRARLHCTACNIHLGSALEVQNNRFVHPMLKVLICKKCYGFYTSGDFDKDEDGSELYCRWCGQGGQVLCCSDCEYVFCKKCIRNNFGRKKLIEIRDSDSWSCFRCKSSQISRQRVTCAEFFEYVRRELSRAATLDDPSFSSTDYTVCCNPQKRLASPEEAGQKKKKKKKLDPDYDPFKDRLQMMEKMDRQNKTVGSADAAEAPVVPNALVQKTNESDVQFVGQKVAGQLVLNPIRFNLKSIFQQQGNNIVRQAAPVQSTQPTAFITVPMTQARPLPPLVPTSKPTYSQNKWNPMNVPVMKHEWFEKTVRAAARVNSHLSYTLTQLNKAQSQAGSIEELAVVHNKLQEILSNSINSLIQIRKNLRSEFIAGIKMVRFPPKQADFNKNDDDVIFVSAPTVVGVPAVLTPVVQVAPQIATVSAPTVTVSASSTTNATTNNNASNEKPRTYLKVKSVFELQNVPSECITIPDEPPKVSTPPVLTDPLCNGAASQSDHDQQLPGDQDTDKSSQDPEPVIVVVDISQDDDDDDKDKEEDSNKETETVTKTSALKESAKENNKGNKKRTGALEESEKENKRARRKRKSDMIDPKLVCYNTASDAPPDIKKMMSVKVHLSRVAELEKMLTNNR